MALGMEVGLGPGHTVLDGDPAPLPKRGQTRRNFRPIFIVAERLSLGMEVGLNPGDFVLDGDPAPYPKRAEPHPIFGPRLLWPNSCMDQDATWYGGMPRPTQHCVRCGVPSYLQKKGTPTPTQSWPKCLLWPNGWMDEDAAWFRSRPRPRPYFTRRGSSSGERAQQPPSLRPVSIVATVAHLSYC